MKGEGPADQEEQTTLTPRWKPDACTVHKAVSGLVQLTHSSNLNFAERTSKRSILQPQPRTMNRVDSVDPFIYPRPDVPTGNPLTYTAYHNMAMHSPDVGVPSIVTGQSRKLFMPRPTDGKTINSLEKLAATEASNRAQVSARFSTNGAFSTIGGSHTSSEATHAINSRYSLKSSANGGVMSPALQLRDSQNKQKALQPPPAHMGSRMLSEKLWCHNRRSTFTTEKKSERPGYWRQAHVYMARTIQEMQQRKGLSTYKSVKKYYSSLSPNNQNNGENLTKSYEASNSTISKSAANKQTQPTSLTVFAVSHSTAAIGAQPPQSNGTQATMPLMVNAMPRSNQAVALTTRSPVAASQTLCTSNCTKDCPIAKMRITNQMQPSVDQARKRSIVDTDQLSASMYKKQKRVTPVFYNESPYRNPYVYEQKIPPHRFPLPEQHPNFINIEKALVAEQRACHTSMKMHYKESQATVTYPAAPEKWFNQSAVAQPMRYYPVMAAQPRTASRPYQNSTHAMHAASHYPYAQISMIPSNPGYYYTPPSF